MKINRNATAHFSRCGEWIMTEEVHDAIRSTIGVRRPEWGGILGSSDGKRIDHYYFDQSAVRTGSSYTMDTDALNRVIHQWNDNDSHGALHRTGAAV